VRGAPNVVDLDGDGALDVVVGTTLGFLYVVDAGTGFVRRGFPMQFGDIEVAIPAAQLGIPIDNGEGVDPHLHMIVADKSGNVAAVSHEATLAWRQKIIGSVTLTPTLGDADGDGFLDIFIFSYIEDDGVGLLYLLRAYDGMLHEGYPLRVSTRFTTPPLLVDLHPGTAARAPAKAARKDVDAKAGAGGKGGGGGGFGLGLGLGGGAPAPLGGTGAGLHVIGAATDGHVYIIEASTGCTNRLDIGEEVHAPMLVTDVTGDKQLDLVVNTISGDIVAFGLGVPHHPLNAVSDAVRGGVNGYTHGMWQGIHLAAAAQESSCVDAIGAYAPITFTITDVSDYAGEYKVRIAQADGTIVASLEFPAPGSYTVLLALNSPGKQFLTLVLVTDTGLRYEEDFCLNYNVQFYRPLKLFLLAPLFVATAAALLYRKNRLAFL